MTVYTLPVCVQCDMTKRTLDRFGVDYTVVNLEDVPDKVAEFRQQGHLSAPIVTTDTKVWSGFRLNKIQSLANHIKSLEK